MWPTTSKQRHTCVDMDTWLLNPCFSLDVSTDFNKPVPVPVVVEASGKVLFIPPVRFRVACHIGEVQKDDAEGRTCRLRLKSWTHSDQQISLKLKDEPVYTETFRSSQGNGWTWHSENAAVQKTNLDCCPGEVSSSVVLNIRLEKAKNPSWLNVFLKK